MLFGKRRIQSRIGGESFADGFLDGYHSILPIGSLTECLSGKSRSAQFRTSAAFDQVASKQ